MAIWGSTVMKLERDPNHYKWWLVWYQYGLPYYEEITNHTEYTYNNRIMYTFLMEDAFKKRALENISRQPEVYVHNMVQNFVTLNIDFSTVMLKTYQFIQERNNVFLKEWLRTGDKQNFYSSKTANSFEWFINILTLLSFLGICVGVWKKNRFLLVPGFAYLSICFAHTITYMDLMYYYVKLPFLFVFTGYFIDAADKLNWKIPFIGWKVSIALIVLILLFGLKLTADVLF